VLIRRAKVFNVYLKRFAEGSVLVRDGLFAAVGEAAESAASACGDAEVLDADGAWLVPGLVDIHMHIESSMTVPSEFSRAVLPHGTTTVVADPHEIANVFGAEGIRAFMDSGGAAAGGAEGRAGPKLDIFWALPSSVPSTGARLETSGGALGPAEIAALAADPRVLCLGEVMNASELIAPGRTRTKDIVDAFRAVRPLAPVEGHCPKIYGAELAAFIASGVWADHTQQTPDSILEKTANGMFLELQRKSLTAENVRAVVENCLFEHVCLATDDVMPDHLEGGHLNLLVARAIELGMSPEQAIYAATYVPARHMGLRDRGSVAPGRIADFILLDDPRTFSIRSVYKRGVIVRRDPPAPTGRAFPDTFYRSVRRAPLSAADFQARPPASAVSEGRTVCVAMKIDPASTFTDYARVPCAVRGGVADWREAGLSLVASVERYGGQSPVRLGFASGALSGEGAVATTWAHDSHNILVMGSSVDDMVRAANALIEAQGGCAVYAAGTELALARLPVGGVASAGPYEILAAEIRAVRAAMRSLGYVHANEIMSFSTLPLLVSPRLKISDKGLIDVKTQAFVESYELPHP